MKKLLKRLYDYFTANQCRKIFFMGALIATILFILALVTRETLWRYAAMISVLVAAVATMLDAMITRRQFLQKIKQMQYDHVQEIFAQREAGQDVPLTPTFSEQERKYLKRRKLSFLGNVLLKVMAVLALMFLLFQ